MKHAASQQNANTSGRGKHAKSAGKGKAPVSRVVQPNQTDSAGSKDSNSTPGAAECSGIVNGACSQRSAQLTSASDVAAAGAVDTDSDTCGDEFSVAYGLGEQYAADATYAHWGFHSAIQTSEDFPPDQIALLEAQWNRLQCADAAEQATCEHRYLLLIECELCSTGTAFQSGAVTQASTSQVARIT